MKYAGERQMPLPFFSHPITKRHTLLRILQYEMLPGRYPAGTFGEAARF